MEANDEELLARVADGDLSCFERLYNKYKGRLMTYLYYTLFDRAKAEDILQETFIRVFRHAGRFKKGRSFPIWLYSIAKNLCRDEWRRSKRRGGAKEPLPFEWVSNTAMKDSRSPRREAETREAAVRLLSELKGLGPEQRETIALHYISALKYREIAQIIGCPLGTVQSRIHTGLKILRRRLKDLL